MKKSKDDYKYIIHCLNPPQVEDKGSWITRGGKG